ncbi:triple tyrosine motif-containing protein [uncultured Mucilaginibacter sp.]|uniref:triple tyrosine motif-containing protein n=1 Tax=uncultured Mucilaginibacter sp. TaxID=797541 RepID=UPI0025F507B9|nr:triple tyrosine motif-containing protein [uncultured Mucilaginibacter sp.]
MRKFYLIILLLFVKTLVFGQNPIGLPQVVNFTSAEYRGGNQNWDIQQDANGIMYFANNEGLLTYNGQNWKLYPIPNKTVVRSVQIADDGKIYTGAQDDIGYFFPNQLGVLKYTSLKHLVPKQDSSFSDVWNVVILGKKVFFRTNARIFELDNGSIRSYESKEGWLYLAKCNGKLIAEERSGQLMELNNTKWEPLATLPAKNIVTAVLSYSGDTMMVATLKEGLFLLHNSILTKKSTVLDGQFSNVWINTMQAIDKNHYAIGSAFNGCYVIDKKGRMVQNFSNEQSLQKNNIRSLFSDRDQNIWLGLDDGISYVAYNSSVKQIYPDANKLSSTYAVRVFKQSLYIGTSDAVFTIPLKDSVKDISNSSSRFIEVQRTKGQVWNLNEVNNHLLLGNEDGAYLIDKNSSKPIYTFPGTWLFKPLSPNQTSKSVIVGTYNGLRLLDYTGNQFTDMGQLDGLMESLRFLTIDADAHTIWASHPYRGVYKIVLSADGKKIASQKLFTSRDGLPSSLHNYVFKIKGRNAVTTEKGVYEYDSKNNRFYQSPYFYAIFKNTELQYLNEDKYGNIWFIGNKKVGVVDFSRSNSGVPFTIVNFPELTAKVVAGFENVYPYDSENVFIGSNRGVFHINYDKYKKNISQPNVLLGQVRIIGDKDSTIFGGYFLSKNHVDQTQNKDSILQFPHSFNSFHFEFSSTLFEQHSNIEFSYQLVGFDTRWSEWSTKSEKEYTNLGYGTYTFRVKARNNLGSESKYVEYSFEIKPAWYQTIWCYMLYVLLMLLTLYSIVKLQQKKHKKAEIQLKYMHQLEMEHNEREIVTLKNEKLEAEVGYKNKELATTTMHLVQRGKLMAKIKEGLLLIKDADANSKQRELLKVLRLINEAERKDSDWDHFAIHFDQVHSNFLTTLKNRFPELSQNDLKMCAYLKMNLSSKEIAQLMSITIRAVEVSRYRLRKKLELPSNVNLFDYLVKATEKVD